VGSCGVVCHVDNGQSGRAAAAPGDGRRLRRDVFAYGGGLRLAVEYPRAHVVILLSAI
jgi:hypothetical protein